MSICIYTHTHGHTNIYIPIHIFRYTHYVLFKSDSFFGHYVWKYWNYSQAVPYRGANLRNCFLPHVSFVQRIFKFRKVISCVYPTVWDEFKNLIQIIRTSVIDKIASYNIYTLTNPFTVTGRLPIYQSKLLFNYMMDFF